MRFIKYALIIAMILSSSSCVIFFVDSDQEVTFYLPSEDSKLYHKDKLIDSGKVVAASLKKQKHPEHIRIETPGYRDQNYCITQSKHTLVYIIDLLLIYPALSQIFEAKRYYYEGEWFLDSAQKLLQYDSSFKNIYFDGITMSNLNDIEFEETTNISVSSYRENHQLLQNTQKAYLKKSKYKFEKDLNKLLVSTNFIDTNYTVFHDNLNFLRLEGKISKVKRYFPYKVVAGHKVSFVVSKLEMTWSIKDIFDKELDAFTISSQSGEFPWQGPYFKIDKDNIFSESISDAILDSYVKLSKKKEVLELFRKEEYVNNFDLYMLSQPNNIASEIPELMQSTVTLENKEKKSHGSGFFVNNEGYLITNHHVAVIDSLTAILADGKKYPTKLIRSDKKSDLALLKIDLKNKFAIKIPDKKKDETGESVLVIGTPKSVELGQTLTKGIVAGIRENNGIRWIQTDASINRGNSGGPCVSSETNELVGVSDYKLMGRGVEGISFLIPPEAIKNYLSIEFE